MIQVDYNIFQMGWFNHQQGDPLNSVQCKYLGCAYGRERFCKAGGI